ncbi:MAG: hypothetical protein ACK4TB_17410, partial [Gemmobacter sp.]
QDKRAQGGAKTGGSYGKGGAPGGKGKGKPPGKDAGRRQDAPVRAAAGPTREGKYDPDSPFAILATLRDRT